MSIYNERNGPLAGTIYAEEDTIPPILAKNSATQKWKKIYH